MVEIRYEFLHALVQIVLEQVPIETAFFRPFVALPKILTHEEELLAGMRMLISEKNAEICELLPHIAGHLVKQRIFSVDDFIMRKGQHEIFSECVDQREG